MTLHRNQQLPNNHFRKVRPNLCLCIPDFPL
jgi:large subunit ribosomal protein L13e